MNYEAVYRRDRWRCRHCDTTHNLSPHHIVFRSHGGTDDLDNLITLCLRCHDAVHMGMLEILTSEICSKFEGSYAVEFRRKGWKP